jgi:DNA ligase-1
MGPIETKFLIRFILKNLKVGANEAIMEMSLAQTFCKQFHANKMWYTTMAIPTLLTMLNLETTNDNEKDIRQLIHNFRNLSFEDKVRFFVGYFKQMETFRRSNKISKEEINNETLQNWVEEIRGVISQYPFHQNVIETFLLLGSLENASIVCCLTPGIPCKPMLAKPTKAINEIFSRFEGKKFTCEYKYDGLRGQIHYYKDPKSNIQKIEMFSRNLENMTEMYQDLVEPIELWAKKNELDSFIVDTEIMAFDPESKRILPFQSLSTRARKKENVHKKQQIDVCLFIFDIIFINQNNLLLNSFEERRNHLDNLKFQDINSKIIRANYKDLTNLEDVQAYLNESVQEGCEGLMVKTLDKDATYQPSRRTFKWLKLKKDYIETTGLGDSFDLVIIGAAWGEGKRTGKYGAFLVASYNDAMDTFESCCRVGTGFSDEDLLNLYNQLKDKVCIFFLFNLIDC